MATTDLSGVGSAAYSDSNSTVKNPKASLTSSDFVSMLITQLQNQDPTQPMTNADMLQQVSQIGTLQSQEGLTSSLNTMTLQNQVSSASGMIGKAVTGLDANGNKASGTVTSIQVQDQSVVLQLDSGSQLSLSNVTSVAAPATVATTSTTAATTGASAANSLLSQFLGAAAAKPAASAAL